MPSTRDIRRRIKSVKNTAQITKAMQMVASSKMRKAQMAALAGRPYAALMNNMLSQVAGTSGDFSHPFMQARDVKKRLVILVSTDKGLCGALNSNLTREAAKFDKATTSFICAGRKGSQFVARTKRELLAEFTYKDSPLFAEARAISKFARELFLKGEVDQVQFVATRYINTLSQQPAVVEFLPIGEIKALQISGVDTGSELAGDTPEVLFEPSPEAVLSYLIGHYLNIFVYRVLLEAKASEQSARMVAMTNATDNATALIKDLALEYNKLRQGNITKELLEIAGGQLGNG